MKKVGGIIAALLLAGGMLHAQELRDSLDAARVTAIRERMQNTTQTGLTRIEGKALNSGVAVFGTPDIVKKLQMLPGVAAGNELSNGLYVHGGDGNDNLFLLDGVPLYNISHFGGLFSSFNTDLVDNLDFYKSGFPARYGGRMSSVVDVETREGDFEKYHGSLSLGMIDGRLQLEGPIFKGKTSFNVGLRRSWMDVITIPAIIYANRRNGEDETVDGSYSMSDFNARITHRFSPVSVLNVNFYTGLDNLKASMERQNKVTGDDGLAHDNNSLMKIGVKWGSLTGSVSHRQEFSKKLKAKNMLYYSQSISDTGYEFNFKTWTGVENVTSMVDDDASYVREIGLKSDWDWYPSNSHHVRFGLSGQYHWYHSSRSFTASSLKGGEPIQESGDDESIGYRSLEPAVYAEDEIFLFYNLTLNVGLRYALFRTDAKTWQSLEPRVAFKWMIVPDLSAKMSYTRMSQFAHLVAAMYMDLPSNSWMPSTNTARPMLSDQIAGGLYFQHKPFTFNVEGWYKTMEHLLVYNGTNSFVPPLTEWEKSFTEGSGNSYGLEVEAGYDNGPLSLTAYYTLSWTRRNFPEFYSSWYLDRNDNRHKINLVAQWHFAKYFNLFLNWNYHSGNRVTFPSHVLKGGGPLEGRYVYDTPYNTQLPDYHRLDFGLDFTRTTSRGHTYKVNLSIYNIYNHLNANFAFLDTDSEGQFTGTAYGLVPIIPTLSFSYQF